MRHTTVLLLTCALAGCASRGPVQPPPVCPVLAPPPPSVMEPPTTEQQLSAEFFGSEPRPTPDSPRAKP